jgi:hypothetical protein
MFAESEGMPAILTCQGTSGGENMKKSQPEHNPILKKTYLEIVDTQLKNDDPPETRQTFDRLRRERISAKDAKLLIASVIATETYDIMTSGKPFNKERFINNLRRLPDQSFLDE